MIYGGGGGGVTYITGWGHVIIHMSASNLFWDWVGICSHSSPMCSSIRVLHGAWLFPSKFIIVNKAITSLIPTLGLVLKCGWPTHWCVIFPHWSGYQSVESTLIGVRLGVIFPHWSGC